MSRTIHEGEFLALINGGGVYRYKTDGEWSYRGAPPGSTQTYSAVTYRGQLDVGTWPESEVIRYDGGEDWTVVGRVGYEREAMATALYNGKCYFGTLPMANVFRMDGAALAWPSPLFKQPGGKKAAYRIPPDAIGSRNRLDVAGTGGRLPSLPV